MGRFKLTDPMDTVYTNIDEGVLNIKTSIINLCSNIDRFFRIRLHIDIAEAVNEYQFNRIKNVFPIFKVMNLEQFNRYLLLIVNIRNVNAHLHVRRPAFIDADLIECLSSVYKPDYAVNCNRVLTMYGQFYILLFASQKFYIWPFITSYFNHKNFVEIDKGTKQVAFQTSLQHRCQDYCCGLKNNESKSMEEMDLNKQFQMSLTKIFFFIEEKCENTNKSFEKTASFRRLLSNCYEFDHNPELVDLISALRNVWLHGYAINDECDIDGKIIKLDYKFVFNSFIDIKNCLSKYHSDNEKIVDEINRFARIMFDFYIQRIVEVTYKMIDNRLLTEDKVDSRIDNLVNSYNRILSVDKDYYELLSKILGDEQMKLSISASKFLDFIPRKTTCDKLRIIKWHSDEGFTIGNFKTNKQDLYLAMVEIKDQYLNLINGIDYRNCSLKKEVNLGDKISIWEVD